MVDHIIESNALWPKELIQFNPSFKQGRNVNQMIEANLPLHPALANFSLTIFTSIKRMPLFLGVRVKSLL